MIESMSGDHPFRCEVSGCSEAPVPLCSAWCLTCGYDLRGSIAAGRCPECGTPMPISGMDRPPGAPTVRSAWWRVWLPLTRPAKMIWFVQADRRPARIGKQTLVLIILAALSMTMMGYASGWDVHKVEWAFACREPVKPAVVFLPDTSRRPDPPGLLRKSVESVQGAYAFGGRSVYIGLGHWGGASGGDGAQSLYWTSPSSGSMVVPAGLPLQHHHCDCTWVSPSLGRAVGAICVWMSIVVAVALVNLVVLPRLMVRLSRQSGGLACRVAIRQGFHYITQGCCCGLLVVGVLWTIGAANPANLLVEYSSAARWVGRILLTLLMFGPAWATARGVGFERGGRLFPRRIVSIVLCIACHVGAVAVLYGVILVIWFLAN